MKFIDEVTVLVRAGDGGDGAVAFRREKFVPQGGPAGGDGGRGGDIVMVVDPGMSTLLDFHYRHDYRAPSGEPGARKDMYGKSGGDLVLRVPPGTQVTDQSSGEKVIDLMSAGQTFIVARGGRGGRGNIHFASSTDRAPHRSEPGQPGEGKSLRLELKLLADVGIVGFPNAGKSSFIARISAARPKIADYPFTTLVPNLGVVRLSDDGHRSRSFVVADVPGLIEGAHTGAGLGHRFLRHLERTRVLLYLIEISPDPARDPLKDYLTLRRELEFYDPELAARPQVVALNKSDMFESDDTYDKIRKKFAKKKVELLSVSAVTGRGMQVVLEALWKSLHAPPVPLSLTPPVPVARVKAAPPKRKPRAAQKKPRAAQRKPVPARKPKTRKAAR